MARACRCCLGRAPRYTQAEFCYNPRLHLLTPGGLCENGGCDAARVPVVERWGPP